MPKEIVLYYGLHSWTAETLINELNDREGEEVIIRVNSPGGEVFASWGIFAKIAEHGNVTVKVDGIAASGAFNLLFYAKNVECLDVSRFMAHRADGYTETATEKQLLKDINEDLRSKMEAKINSDEFKKVTGISIEDLFNPESRIDVWLTAKQMKKLGVVGKINKVTPTEAKQLAEATTEWALQIAATADPSQSQPPAKPVKTMTIEKLKAENPDVYAQVVKIGAEAERDRVGAWLAYAEIDSKKALEGAKSDKSITATVQAEFQVAAMSGDRLKKLTADSTPKVETTADEVIVDPKLAAKKKEQDEFQAKLDAAMGRKPKTTEKAAVAA